MVEWELGHRKIIFDLIVTELVTDGTFSVIERNRLDEILAEQNLGDSSQANPSSAARIGKVLGVNTMIVGNITQFGTEQRRKDSAELSEKSEASVEVPRHPERCDPQGQIQDFLLALDNLCKHLRELVKPSLEIAV